jgi:hypothetical protein
MFTQGKTCIENIQRAICQIINDLIQSKNRIDIFLKFENKIDLLVKNVQQIMIMKAWNDYVLSEPSIFL